MAGHRGNPVKQRIGREPLDSLRAPIGRSYMKRLDAIPPEMLGLTGTDRKRADKIRYAIVALIEACEAKQREGADNG